MSFTKLNHDAVQKLRTNIRNLRPFKRSLSAPSEVSNTTGIFIISEMLEETLLSGLEMDRDFLRGILRQSESDPALEIVDVECSPGCDIGDNFMSAVTRINITAETVHRNCIKKTVLMKRQPASVARRQAFRCDPAFKNEAGAYRVVIPALQSFARSKMPFPECLHASSQFVVLEDLKQAGFKMADRTMGLDIQHAKLALKELGRFHGTSLAMKAAQPANFDLVKDGVQELVFVPDAVPVFGASLENSLRMALMALEVYRAAGETAIQEAVHKMQILRGSVFQKMLTLVRPREPLAVMCHGDFYINNMMFKYNDKDEVKDVIFVDLQVCRYASLATDILYFLYSSLQPGVVDLYHDDLLEVYHSSLNHQIATLAPFSKQVSFEDIQEEIELHALYGLIMSFLILPAVTALPGTLNLDKVESTSISEFVESARDILSPTYFERVREVVLAFVNRGYI